MTTRTNQVDLLQVQLRSSIPLLEADSALPILQLFILKKSIRDRFRIDQQQQTQWCIEETVHMMIPRSCSSLSLFFFIHEDIIHYITHIIALHIGDIIQSGEIILVFRSANVLRLIQLQSPWLVSTR